MFTKNKLSLAVAIAAGFATMQAAQADSVFFPYVVGSETVSTIISVVNTADDLRGLDPTTGTNKFGANNIHYALIYKQSVGGVVSNAAVCEETNYDLPTSYNDIQTSDLTGYFADNAQAPFSPNGQGVLFNDPSNNNNWVASGRDFALGRGLVTPGEGFRGYMLVDNEFDSESGQSTVSGEALLLEYANGSAWGYQGFTQLGDDVDTDTAANSEFDYFYARTQSPVPVNLPPVDEFNVAFLVTPVNINDDVAEDLSDDRGLTTEALGENMSQYWNLAASIKFTSEGTTNTFALFDRDENPISGAQEQVVVCVGRVPASSMVSAASAQRLVNGGWGNLANRRTNIYDETGTLLKPLQQPQFDDEGEFGGAVVFKHQVNLGSTFNGVPINGIFNDGSLLMPAMVGQGDL